MSYNIIKKDLFFGGFKPKTDHILQNPKLVPTQKQQIMILQQQNALQQRNEQIERELDEMEKELKKKNALQQRNEQLEKEIQEKEKKLQETKEKNAENEKNVKKKHINPMTKPKW